MTRYEAALLTFRAARHDLEECERHRHIQNEPRSTAELERAVYDAALELADLVAEGSTP